MEVQGAIGAIHDAEATIGQFIQVMNQLHLRPEILQVPRFAAFEVSLKRPEAIVHRLQARALLRCGAFYLKLAWRETEAPLKLFVQPL